MTSHKLDAWRSGTIFHSPPNVMWQAACEIAEIHRKVDHAVWIGLYRRWPL